VRGRAGQRECMSKELLAARLFRWSTKCADPLAKQSTDLFGRLPCLVDVDVVLPLVVDRTDDIAALVNDRHANLDRGVWAKGDVVEIAVDVGNDLALAGCVHATHDAPTKGDACEDVPGTSRRDAAEMIVHG